MTATRQTALGLERDGKRIVLIAGHRDGVTVRVEHGAYAPADVEHLMALLGEQLTNFRLKNEEPAMIHGRDPLSPARGIFLGLIVSVGLYLAVGAVILAVRGAQHDLGPNLHLGARE